MRNNKKCKQSFAQSKLAGVAFDESADLLSRLFRVKSTGSSTRIYFSAPCSFWGYVKQNFVQKVHIE